MLLWCAQTIECVSPVLCKDLREDMDNPKFHDGVGEGTTMFDVLYPCATPGYGVRGTGPVVVDVSVILCGAFLESTAPFVYYAPPVARLMDMAATPHLLWPSDTGTAYIGIRAFDYYKVGKDRVEYSVPYVWHSAWESHAAVVRIRSALSTTSQPVFSPARLRPISELFWPYSVTIQLALTGNMPMAALAPFSASGLACTSFIVFRVELAAMFDIDGFVVDSNAETDTLYLQHVSFYIDTLPQAAVRGLQIFLDVCASDSEADKFHTVLTADGSLLLSKFHSGNRATVNRTYGTQVYYDNGAVRFDEVRDHWLNLTLSHGGVLLRPLSSSNAYIVMTVCAAADDETHGSLGFTSFPTMWRAAMWHVPQHAVRPGNFDLSVAKVPPPELNFTSLVPRMRWTLAKHVSGAPVAARTRLATSAAGLQVMLPDLSSLGGSAVFDISLNGVDFPTSSCQNAAPLSNSLIAPYPLDSCRAVLYRRTVDISSDGFPSRSPTLGPVDVQTFFDVRLGHDTWPSAVADASSLGAFAEYSYDGARSVSNCYFASNVLVCSTPAYFVVTSVQTPATVRISVDGVNFLVTLADVGDASTANDQLLSFNFYSPLTITSICPAHMWNSTLAVCNLDRGVSRTTNASGGEWFVVEGTGFVLNSDLFSCRFGDRTPLLMAQGDRRTPTQAPLNVHCPDPRVAPDVPLCLANMGDWMSPGRFEQDRSAYLFAADHLNVPTGPVTHLTSESSGKPGYVVSTQAVETIVRVQGGGVRIVDRYNLSKECMPSVAGACVAMCPAPARPPGKWLLRVSNNGQTFSGDSPRETSVPDPDLANAAAIEFMPCAPAYWSPEFTQACQLCAHGSSNPLWRQASCPLCPSGSYQELAGQVECKRCVRTSHTVKHWPSFTARAQFLQMSGSHDDADVQRPGA